MSLKKKNLLFMAQLCKNVYESTLPVYSDIENHEMFSSSITDCQMYIIKLKEKNTYIISFRGSDSNLDWKYNFQILLVPLINYNPVLKEKQIFYKIPNNIKVHKGFYTQFISLQHEIFNYFDKLNHNELKIITIGHSLGGGIAYISSFITRLLYPNSTNKCYTYGSPRAGNKHFSKIYKRLIPNCIRVVNNYDTICLLPTPLFYRHNGILILLKQKKNDTNTEYILQLFKTARKNIISLIICNPSEIFTKEHNISLYIDRINQLQDLIQ